MIRPLILFLIAFTTLFCKAQANKADTSLKMLGYGLPDMAEYRAEKTVAKKYGFTYYGVAGCSITKELKDSVEKENKRVSKILEQRFGHDWEKTFNKKVDTMMILQAQVEKLVKKESYIKAARKEGHWLYYYIDPVDGQNVFAVKVSGWGKWKGEDAIVIYYKLTVDLARNKVNKDSDTLELDEYN